MSGLTGNIIPIKKEIMMKIDESRGIVGKAYLYSTLRFLFIILIIYGIYLVFDNPFTNALFYTFLLIVFTLYLIIMWRNATFKYTVGKESISAKSGIINKKSRIVSYDKVQNVDTSDGIIMRLFGISYLEIWTASLQQVEVRNGKSSNQAELKIIMRSDEAAALQKFISDNTSKDN